MSCAASLTTMSCEGVEPDEKAELEELRKPGKEGADERAVEDWRETPESVESADDGASEPELTPEAPREPSPERALQEPERTKEPCLSRVMTEENKVSELTDLVDETSELLAELCEGTPPSGMEVRHLPPAVWRQLEDAASSATDPVDTTKDLADETLDLFVALCDGTAPSGSGEARHLPAVAWRAPEGMFNQIVQRITGQLDYYFSDANLGHDVQLRSLMSPCDGWVSLVLLASFPRLHALSCEPWSLREAAECSWHLEVDPEGFYIRICDHKRRDRWTVTSGGNSKTVIVEAGYP